MLQAKYYEDFKGCKNCLLIAGDSESFEAAAMYFKTHNAGPLFSDKYISVKNVQPDTKQIALTNQERKDFAAVCEKLAAEKKPVHEYFSVSSAPDMEIIISCGEYDKLPE